MNINPLIYIAFGTLGAVLSVFAAFVSLMRKHEKHLSIEVGQTLKKSLADTMSRVILIDEGNPIIITGDNILDATSAVSLRENSQDTHSTAIKL